MGAQWGVRTAASALREQGAPPTSGVSRDQVESDATLPGRALSSNQGRQKVSVRSRISQHHTSDVQASMEYHSTDQYPLSI